MIGGASTWGKLETDKPQLKQVKCVLNTVLVLANGHLVCKPLRYVTCKVPFHFKGYIQIFPRYLIIACHLSFILAL